MPVYTYQCEECGVRFDARQRFSDAPISVCPECGGATHKVIGPVGVVFKGSGFYVNDSRSNNSALKSPAAHKKDGETPAATTSTETKTETKSSPATSTSTD
jgi:putative FmdB family regulatory protein